MITLAVILGQSLFGTLGVLLAGQPLKTAMQCGFSRTQIGECAFIIASLGVSLHVTSHFLYPIVVAVSVITTFLTPYTVSYTHLDVYKRQLRDVTERYIPLCCLPHKWQVSTGFSKLAAYKPLPL